MGAPNTGPQAAGKVATSGTGANWIADGASLQADLAASNDSRAVAANVPVGNTKYLDCTDFGFTIPESAVVTGVEVAIEHNMSGPGTMSDETVQLLVGGSRSGDNKAAAGQWPTSDATATYGGAGDTWGNSLTPAICNASNFGVSIRGKNDSFGDNATARIDLVTMTVTYRDAVIRGIRLTFKKTHEVRAEFHQTIERRVEIPLTEEVRVEF